MSKEGKRRHSLSIWKHTFTLDLEQEVGLPYQARLLHTDVQNGRPRLWFSFVPEHQVNVKVRPRRFVMLPTGGEWLIPADVDPEHVGTFLLHGGELVVHLFELVEKPAEPRDPGK